MVAGSLCHRTDISLAKNRPDSVPEREQGSWDRWQGAGAQQRVLEGSFGPGTLDEAWIAGSLGHRRSLEVAKL